MGASVMHGNFSYHQLRKVCQLRRAVILASVPSHCHLVDGSARDAAFASLASPSASHSAQSPKEPRGGNPSCYGIITCSVEAYNE